MSFYDDFTPFKFRVPRGNNSNFAEDLWKQFDNGRTRQHFKDFPDSAKAEDFTEIPPEFENLRRQGSMFDGVPNDFFGAGRHGDLRSRMGAQHPAFFRTFDSSPSRGSSTSSAQSSSGERVIPIHVCREDGEATKKPTQQTANSEQATSAMNEESKTDAGNKPSDNQKSYSTQRNLTTEMPRVRELQRGQRAQSAPPTSTEIPVTECGGGQSKKPSNTGIRHIPIVVENTQGSAKASSTAAPPTQQQPASSHQGASAETKPTGGAGDQESKPTPAKKPTLILDPLAKIKAVSDQVKELAKKVQEFSGPNTHKDYLYLDEMLTRLLIQLDDVEVEGKDDVRQARRECIKLIQKCISDLESRAQSGKSGCNDQVQNVDETSQMDSIDCDPPAVEATDKKPEEVSETAVSPAKEEDKKKVKPKKEAKTKTTMPETKESKGPHPPTFRSEVTLTVGDTPDTTEKSNETMDTSEAMETA